MSEKRRDLTRAVVVNDLTAAASPSNCRGVLLVTRSVPMGSGCQKTTLSYIVKVQRVTQIAPAKLKKGSSRSAKR